MDAGIGEIVDIKEFPPWRAGPPDQDIRSAGGLSLHGSGRNQCGDDVAVFRVIIIAPPIQIGPASH